ncbi:MAG: hypothetical protein KHX03_00345 [Clostridium sp.]|nr:hypothetical protein [Clostridium sp.]
MKKVYAYIHTHWDREWYREFEEFRLRLVEVIDDVLKKLSNNEIPAFYFDGQTSALDDYLEIRPENEELIKSFIKEKRLFIGPYYCSTDSFLIDRESLIKNLQIGIKESEKFGCNDFIAYHADTFGHSRFIPEIVKYFKIPYSMFWRGLGELEAEFLFRNLKTTYLIEGYFHDYFNANVSYEKKAEMLKRTLDRISKYSTENILLPLGADHMKCPDNLAIQLKEVNKYLKGYKIILSTPFEYLNSVKNSYQKRVDCEFRDTTRNFILPGVYSSRIDLKQENAKLQWKLARIVQPLQAITNFLNLSANFQSYTDYLYKKLLNNHPHDSIYGCSIDNVHKENKVRNLTVSEGSDAILNSIRRDLCSDNSLSVINISNYNFSGALKITSEKKLDKKFNAQLISKRKGFPLLKVYDINQVPITEDYTTLYEYLIDIKEIPEFSLKTLKESDINKSSSLKISDTTIENNYIKLSVKNNKIEIYDKTKNKLYKNFISFTDKADIGDSYNFGALKNDIPFQSKIIKSKIKKSGPIRSTLEVQFALDIPSKSTEKGRSKSIKKHILKLLVTLENQNKYIEFNLEYENKSLNHILQVEFNLENKITETESDDLSGIIKRKFDPEYDIYKLIPAPRGIELKLNTAPLQKFVYTQGIGIITEGLQEYDIRKNKLALTLLRATGTISNPHNPTRGTPAGPPLLTPDLQMQGKNGARFAICFADNVNELEKHTEAFYQSALLFCAELKDEKLLEFNNKHIQISTIKTNKYGDLIIRFVNKSETKEKLNFNTKLENKGIYVTDAMENIANKYENQIIMPNSFLTIAIKKA